MALKRKDELKACLQNGVPCELLLGYWDEAPEDFRFHVMCGIGWECGRGACSRYEPASFVSKFNGDPNQR